MDVGGEKEEMQKERGQKNKRRETTGCGEATEAREGEILIRKMNLVGSCFSLSTGSFALAKEFFIETRLEPEFSLEFSAYQLKDAAH